MLEQKFIGRLNSDDADRDLEQAVRDCLNLIPQDGGLGTTPRRENVKGNELITNDNLPSGNNITIGTFEDKDSQRVVYFNYNANSDHCIFVYEKNENRIYKVLETSELNWSNTDLVTGAGIIKDQLIFTDTKNEVRSFDITLGKNTFDVNENKKWELLPTDDTNNFIITVTKTDTSVVNINVTGTDLSTIASTISASGVLTATVCGEIVEIIEDVTGDVASFVSDNNYGIAPINFYTTPIDQQQITLINYPLPCSPLTGYETDTTRTVNFLTEKAFQFAVRYVYFDDSESTISPYSKLTVKRDCGLSSDKVDNCINVEFKDTSFSQKELQLIKNVEILFREGNSGSFFKAATLERFEFFEGSYNFYNDGGYDVIPDTDVSKQFDSIPNKANALTILKNRLFIGGYTEGYDTPCVDADIEVDIEEGVAGVGNTWTITGRIRITNRFLQPLDDGTIFHNNQPIHSRDGETSRESWVYGGMGSNGVKVLGFYPNTGGSVTASNHESYAQFIPEGGFTVFLAGTNFYGISKQFTKSYSSPVDNDADVVSSDPIVYKTDQKGDVFDDENEYGRTAVRHIMAEDNVYSTFEIKGVPPGKYILRVASPLCARTENLRSDTDEFYDLNGDISKWQSTSAQVVNINGIPADYGSNVDEFYPDGPSTEMLIELGDSGGVYDIHSGDSVKSILIADLTDTADLGNSVINQGYLVDPENKDEEGFKSSLRMERQRIALSKNTNNVENTADFEIITDHNGLFWAAWKAGFLNISGMNFFLLRTLAYNGGSKDTTTFPVTGDVNENNVYEIKHANQTQYKDADISDVYNGNIITGGFTEQKDWSNNTFKTTWIMYNYNSRVRDYGRTIIQAKVTDPDGSPLSGLLSQITNTGRYETTDTEGLFNIITYADTDETLPDMSRSENVLIGKGNNACVSFTDIKQAFTATPISNGNFDNSNPYVLSDIVISDLVENTSSIYKRGGVYKWGLVYYDEALRSSFTATTEDLRKRIPFTTDDLGDVLPDKYASPTFRYGNAKITWTINSQPPEWAHYYQWVRTKDTAFNSFLTWVANDVIYASEWDDEDVDNQFPVDVGFESSLAKEIYIDISNIATYINQNSDARIGYNFTEGDRIILIKNDGDFFETYIDLEVKGQRGDYIIIENLGSLVELLPGLLFQVYTPKLQNETEIYYEMGECYKVLNPETPSRSHEETTGEFVAGDAYQIGRNIPIEGGALTENCEHPTVSDKETERYSDIGRPNTVNVNAKPEYFFSSVRFSNPFIQNSYDNGLPSFNSLDKEDLPLERGPINKMIGTTNVILAIHNTEASSLYIGEGFLHTADGGAIENKTDKIIGDERLLKGEYGTINPESVVEYDDVVYWWDQNKGDVIRYSNNGLTPLGLVEKYRNKMLELQEAKRSSSNVKVIGGYNPLWDMALMTFKDINGEDVTLGFHERTDDWVTRFSFAPQAYTYIDTKMYSFKLGELYEHDMDSADRNTFYGVNYPSQVHVVSSLNNEIEKIYRSIGVKSNEKWAAIRIFNKDGQETNLVLNDYIRRDDMYYSDILRNINTATDTLQPGQIPLLHGEVMRSQVMEFVLENTSVNEVEIDYIVIDFQESPGHLINRQ